MAIDWKPFSPKALDFLRNSNAKLNIAHGSVRSSKTVTQTVRWLTYVLQGPPGDLVMLGKSIGTLQRNVLNDLFDIVGVQNYKWVNKQQGELILLGRRIFAMGANNEGAEAKIRGATFAGAYCDEANLYPESVWMQLMARLSVEGAMCFANCNPDSPYHWFYLKVIMNDEIKSKKIWHFTMEDNLALTAEYRTQLASMYTGVYKRRFIDGEWCVADGLIYDGFLVSRHVVHYSDEYIAQHGIRYFISCDHGTSTVESWSMMVELNDRSGHIHKMGEYYYDAQKAKIQKSDNSYLQDFKKWEGAKRSLANMRGGWWKVYVDPAANTWHTALSEASYRVQHADNSVIDGIRNVITALSQDLYTMDTSCVHTIEEYETYSWDPVYQLKGIDKPLKKNDHACDSDRYGIRTYMAGRLNGVYRFRR